MYRIILFICSLLIAIGLSIFPSPLNHPATAIEQTQPTTPLFDNLGDHHHPISTKNPVTQRYFDQGLILTYGFNHAEAERAFRTAAQLDPDCAICYWGIALVIGPNLNAAMGEDAISPAWQAIETAIELSDKASDKEQAYIQALAKRYTKYPVADRKQLDLDYANAMREVVQNYPQDLDAATLFADALMNTMPWNYWQEDGTAKPATQEVLATLESILQRQPNHIGANHLYIHAVEAQKPELAVAAADRLDGKVPGAGHLVHMPSHIYIRVGRYHDAAIANQKAIKADQDYLKQVNAQGIYPLAYMKHNHHFLWASASLEGRSELALQAARDTAKVDHDKMYEPEWATLQHYYSIPLYTLARFGKWEEIMQEPAPDKQLKYPTGVWHYARGLAFTAKGQLDKASEELAQLQAIATDPEVEKIKIWDINSTASLLKIASEVLAGEIAAKQSNYPEAIAHLETAVNLEDALTYTEPADWYYPVRQSLGAVLLEAGQPAQAEQVYQEDLKRYPENGWSLLGLAESLRQQGKTEAAQAVQQRFEEAWKHADIQLTASRF
ncbi:MAG: tetratricopeptide repeat protein [Coleofasciculaceae cyanobacterium]